VAERNDAHGVRSLARLLPIDAIPITRAAIGLETTTDASDKVVRLGLPAGAHPTSYIEGMHPEIHEELIRALTTRVNERRQPLRKGSTA